MPRYHFNVYSDHGPVDVAWVELPSLADARCEAVRYASRCFIKNATSVMPGSEWCMEVTDDFGLVLFQIDFNLRQSPAAEAAFKAA